MIFNKFVDTISQHCFLNYGILIMKKLAFLLLASLSAPVFADPTVFKMELGKTTESEVKEMYSTTLNGVNIYTDGNQYYIDTKEIDFDGLKSAEVIFDKQGVLVAVLSTLVESDPMNHGRFSHIYGILNNKYKLVKKENGHSLVSLQLETGRTHQIRIHMKYLGYPLIGDYLYNPDMEHITRQALHSYHMEFPHPITGQKMTFTAPLPPDMSAIISL